MANVRHNDLFSTLISNIKHYNGKDPLLPWLQGIKKLKESLPPQILKEKLPRFLQKCARTFEAERRYRNDLRYLRVWIQLMDFVDDPRLLLRTMETNRIGMKWALFYQAYALYYEKLKKFEESEKMYHLGVRNLAEPAGVLQSSYEQFLHRMELYKKRKTKRKESRAALTSRSNSSHHRITNLTGNDDKKVTGENDLNADIGVSNQIKSGKNIGRESDKKPTVFCNEDTVVVKFVDSAIVGKSEAEDACHHGLVDPTINMKEAMNAINNMFREPLETAMKYRRSRPSRPKVNPQASDEFEVFIDESLDNGGSFYDEATESGVSHVGSLKNLKCANPASSNRHSKAKTQNPSVETFKILADDDDDNGECQNKHPVEGSALSFHVNAFEFPRLEDPDIKSSPHVKLKDDTVVCRFVGSTIFGEPEVENACHHGLVDPTINLKEAMDDINSMFGKPLDFVKTSKPSKTGILLNEKKQDNQGFSIFADEDLEEQQQRVSSCSSSKLSGECDLFEPTVFTKEAMDEINQMFGRPMDF